jgi:hypothetical protein
VPSDCSIVGIVDTINPPQGNPSGTPIAAAKPRNSARANSRRSQ